MMDGYERNGEKNNIKEVLKVLDTHNIIYTTGLTLLIIPWMDWKIVSESGEVVVISYPENFKKKYLNLSEIL